MQSSEAVLYDLYRPHVLPMYTMVEFFAQLMNPEAGHLILLT